MTARIFLNLSNHPSDKWSEIQADTALSLCDEIVNFQFPQVPPEFDSEQVGELAIQIMSQIPDNVTHAMIMGEFALVYALVTLFRERGIIPLVATTVRNVVELPDGTKQSKFDFVRFREYPDLGIK